jgi:hypothetical protein
MTLTLYSKCYLFKPSSAFNFGVLGFENPCSKYLRLMSVLLQFNITLNIVNWMLWIWYARDCGSWCSFLLLEIGCPMRVVDLVLQFFYHRLAECRRLFSCEMLKATERTARFYRKWGKRKLEKIILSYKCPFFFRRFHKMTKSEYYIHRVCPLCPRGTTRPPLEGLSWNLTYEWFSKMCREC